MKLIRFVLDPGVPVALARAVRGFCSAPRVGAWPNDGDLC